MYRLVISNYEEKQKELMEENSDLRTCLTDMQKELHTLLRMRTGRTRVSRSLSMTTILVCLSSPLYLIPTFMWVRCLTIICLHVARSYTSSPDSPFSKISSFTVSNYLLSSLPSPLYIHFHRPPSYVVLLSLHHLPIPHQPPFLDFL